MTQSSGGGAFDQDDVRNRQWLGSATGQQSLHGVGNSCREGAELAFTYQNEKLKSRVEDAAKEYGSQIVIPLDVSDDAQIAACFESLKKHWDHFDILVHAIAYAPREAIEGEFLAGLTRARSPGAWKVTT